MAGNQAPPPPPPPRIDHTFPYYLGPHDRPGDFITPTRLRGDNYDVWANDMQTAIEARRKFVFLNGSITTPAFPCTQDDWNTLYAMLISWLTNTIDPEVKATLSKYKDARKLWETLKSRYSMILHMFLHILNWPISSQRHSTSHNLILFCPSWAFSLRMLQLEGVLGYYM